MASKAAPYPQFASAHSLKGVLFRYAVSFSFLILPAALTPMLLPHKSLAPMISGVFVLTVAAAGWWGGVIPGVLVSLAVVPVFTLLVTHGAAILPPKLDYPAMVVLAGVGILCGLVASARRRVEQVLQSANERLEIGVRERTADLERARELLEQNNQELQQFAYAASHDLQEPLRNLTIYTQLLQRKHSAELSADAAQVVRHLVTGAERMNALLADLLAYTRVWGAAADEIVPTDLRLVYNAVVSSLGATIQAASAQIECGELPVLNMTEVHAQQLLQNLIGNALKYRSEAPPRIRLDSRPSGRGWLVSVADNGIGIDPAYKERIFEPFKRLHGKERYPGTGIGLALCQKIVLRYGGRIWVESEPGKGSTFFFTVPAEVDSGKVNRTSPTGT